MKQQAIDQYNIKCLITATANEPPIEFPNVTNLKIEIEDTPSAEIGPHFDKCIEFIEKTSQNGGCTLVHCRAGISRSASICIAYMMKTRNMTLKQAYRYVKQRRDIIHPNAGFFRQLIAYEESLYGTTSVKMVETSCGVYPDVYDPQYQEEIGRRSKPSKYLSNMFNKLFRRK